MTSLKSPRAVALTLALISLTLAPALRALDAGASPAALDILTTRAQAYAKLRIACEYLNGRVALISKFRREADELAPKDFAQAAPRYAAVLAVLQTALATEQVDGLPPEEDQRMWAARWNQARSSAEVWGLATNPNQAAYRLDDLQAAYTNGRIAHLIQGCEDRISHLAKEKQEAAAVFTTKLSAARGALDKEQVEIDAARIRLVRGGEQLRTARTELEKRSREIDDLSADYKHDGEKLQRDVERFNRSHGTIEQADELRHRQLNLEAYRDFIREKSARLNLDVDAQDDNRRDLLRLEAETKERSARQDVALAAVRQVELIAGPVE